MADKVGLEITKNNIDTTFGTFFKDLNALMVKGKELMDWMDTKTVADLEAVGYTTSEANLLKSAGSEQSADYTHYEANHVFRGRIHGFGVNP